METMVGYGMRVAVLHPQSFAVLVFFFLTTSFVEGKREVVNEEGKDSIYSLARPSSSHVSHAQISSQELENPQYLVLWM